MMELQRRAVLGGAIAGAALLQGRAFAQSGPNLKTIPWSDQPPPVPAPLENVVKGQTALGGPELVDHTKRQVLQHRPL